MSNLILLIQNANLKASIRTNVAEKRNTNLTNMSSSDIFIQVNSKFSMKNLSRLNLKI